ncbi:MAG: hypothetical protein JXR89_00435, partial [Deltaproteobacteria bacterium]|nr:hypothetical protein [Deltaproteobacteria bacterium]
EDLFRQLRPWGWSLPLADDHQAYGIMALLHREPFTMDSESIIFFQIICRQLTLALRSFILSKRDEKRVRRLKFLHRIGAQLNTGREPQSVFAQLPDSGLTFFADSASILHVFAQGKSHTDHFEQGFSSPEQYKVALAASQYQYNRARFFDRPLVIDKLAQIPEDAAYKEFSNYFSAHIILPLISQGEITGILEFFLGNEPLNRELLPLTGEDIELLRLLADHLAATVERTKTQNQLKAANLASELRTRQLTLSHQMKNALLAADTPEKIIRLTLGALVSDEGFKCSPAIYLDLNEREKYWQGLFHATVDNLSGRGPKKLEGNKYILEKLSSHLLEATRLPGKKDANQIGKIRLPDSDMASKRFQKILKHKKPALIEARFINLLHSELKTLLPASKIVTIPVFNQERLRGLMLANGDRISSQDLDYITSFTDAAALALENTELFQRLQNSLASLNNAQHRLAQSEKLMALGEMATSIAHEIKNPLVSIAGFARRLHRKIPDQTQEKTYSQIITKEIERLEEIVNNVLSFSKLEGDKFSGVNINQLVEDTVALFARQLRSKRIKTKIDLNQTLAEVECDGNQLKQVIINLINNSIQAMTGVPEQIKRQLQIRTSYYCDLKDHEVKALIEIADNGEGIQEQFIHDIFNPFFTTKHDGTGLGLPICHRIIMNHQGEIRIHNRVGKGVMVSVSLPFLHKIQPGPTA